jgi:hypothetical protein
MQRLTARILLVLMLVGIFTPLALAIDLGALAPHACCMRRGASSNSSTIAQLVIQTEPGNCCPPVVTAHWATTSTAVTYHYTPLVSTSRRETYAHDYTNDFDLLTSGRAPPVFFHP